MSVLIKYKDIAIGARKDFNVEVGRNLPSSNNNLFQSDVEEFIRYDTPFDLNSMALDGESVFLPEDGSYAYLSFISDEISNENSDFETPIQFVLTSNKTYSSAGISIVADEKKNIYPSKLSIDWYNNETLLDSSFFYPTSANYFCGKNVQFYNKIVIKFYSLNVPYNRLRINFIEHGLNVQFKGDELKSAKISQEIDPISTSVPINPFDFELVSKKDIEFSFQTKQPITVFFNNELKSTCFVKSVKRRSKNSWQVSAEDYIGLMDSIPFVGGMYENKNAKDLLVEIFTVSKVPFNIDESFNDLTVSGYIPYTTCRDALMQVCFAIQAIADTSNSDKVNVFALDKEISQQIPKKRIMQGQSFEEQTRVTAFELTAHSYNKIAESVSLYEAQKSGEGNNIFVSFNEPAHSLSIINGTILESGVNYAAINANAGCILTGQKYDHTTTVHRKNNPFVLTTDIENIVAIQNATLVSKSNVDILLESCYNHIVNANQTSMKIVDGKHELFETIKYGQKTYGSFRYGEKKSEVVYDKPTTVGDLIEYETEYLSNKIGRITKQTFSLNGGIMVKDSIVR